MNPGVSSTHATIQARTNGSPRIRGSSRFARATPSVRASAGTTAQTTASARELMGAVFPEGSGVARRRSERRPVVTVKSYAAPYVASDAGALAGALVLRPSAAVDRLPPIKGEPSPIAGRAIEQHAIFTGRLRALGVTVHEIAPATESATESLIADCAIVLPNGAVIARPSQIERRAEVAAVEKHLAELGIPIAGRIEAPGLLDATDVALAPGRVFVGVPRAGAGLRRRSNELGRKQLEAIASQQGFRVVELAVA